MTPVTDTPAAGPLSEDELAAIDAWWRAANYLAVGQIYLMDNPLLRDDLRPAHIKPRLLGHWGTSPGLSFVYAHLNRVIRARDLHMLYVPGPGHGAPAILAAAWLDGTYSELYPQVSQDADGMERLFTQFSFPGGVASHTSPEVPGSIQEGGELGYALPHAFGAAFDNPDLVVTCVVGDGEAETGATATAWHSTKFLDPVHDGAVLPVLHLNGYKIANPTVLARISEDELCALFRGYGWEPHLVAGEDPRQMHQDFAATLDECLDEIAEIQRRARQDGETGRARWPMVILRSPKGWTGPDQVDGEKVEGFWRSHQVPVEDVRSDPEHLQVLREWLQSYRPEELFDEAGRPVPQIRDLHPHGDRRLSATPYANGGMLLRDLRQPDFTRFAVQVDEPGRTRAKATTVLGEYLAETMRLNDSSRNFRLFSPDENNSNRLDAVLTVTPRAWNAETLPEDVGLGLHGRVMEVLSEHTCQGWLEGYLLTGRHGFFSCYEAFVHIVDSMVNQHAKWLTSSKDVEWRRPVASLTYLLTSHVWRQDHNGFTHQDPGFIDHVVNKKADIIRVYLPPDANTLLSTAHHCLDSRDYINVIVAGKQSEPQYLSMDEAIAHCTKGIGIWDWASTDAGERPDLVMAAAGDVPTKEALAATDLLLGFFPDLKIRFVNVVDLMRLQDEREHPHGLSDTEFDSLFTTDVPIIFNYHGYPWLIHRLTYRRTNHHNLHVRGYKEEGTTTTPFDMAVLNQIDRFNLAIDAIDRLPRLGPAAAHVRQHLRDRLIEHRIHIRRTGEDLPEVRDWSWTRRHEAAQPEAPDRQPGRGDDLERWISSLLSTVRGQAGG